MAIICIAFLLGNETPKLQRLQDSHHLRWFIILNLQICSILITSQEKTGINVRTDQYMEIMFKRKAMMDQIIIDRKTYEKNTQWIRENEEIP